MLLVIMVIQNLLKKQFDTMFIPYEYTKKIQNR